MNHLKIARWAALLGLGCSGGDGGTECGPGTVEDNGVCIPGGNADGGASGVDAGGEVPPGALQVFVTSTDYERDLGGRAGATNLCSAAASAAGLPGVFVPWLSDFDTEAINGVFGDGPWYSTGDELVFMNRANLATSPRVAISRDEFGSPVPIESTPRVWTGTAAGGTRDNICDGNWFGTGIDGFATVGSLNSSSSEWTDSENIDCIAGGTTAHLYCFERPTF